MNLYEYCKKNNLDLSGLSKSSLAALGNMFLENINPTPDEICRLRAIDNGSVSLKEAMQRTLEKAKKLSKVRKKLEEHVC